VVGCHKGRVFIYSATENKVTLNCVVGFLPNLILLMVRQAWSLTQEFQAHEQYLLKCVLSPDASTLATTSADKTVHIYLMGNLLSTANLSSSAAGAAQQSGTGSMIAATTTTASITSPGNMGAFEYKSLSQHQKWVWDAVFSADSYYLVSVSSDLSGKLWDLRSGNVIQNYSGHNLAVTCVALHDSNH
jgi:G protein beta subunit-like protein